MASHGECARCCGSSNQLFVIESVFDEDIEHKQRIIKTFDFLCDAGLSGVTPYMKSRNGDPIVRCGHRNWQLVKYINGVSLDRPAYVFEKWRGKVLADFLKRTWGC